VLHVQSAERADPAMPLDLRSLIVLVDERLTAIHRFFHAGLTVRLHRVVCNLAFFA